MSRTLLNRVAPVALPSAKVYGDSTELAGSTWYVGPSPPLSQQVSSTGPPNRPKLIDFRQLTLAGRAATREQKWKSIPRCQPLLTRSTNRLLRPIRPRVRLTWRESHSLHLGGFHFHGQQERLLGECCGDTGPTYL